MPGGDGTGPLGKGGGNWGYGSTGEQFNTSKHCQCISCGKKINKQRRTPCKDISCPDCGAKMRRG